MADEATGTHLAPEAAIPDPDTATSIEPFGETAAAENGPGVSGRTSWDLDPVLVSRILAGAAVSAGLALLYFVGDRSLAAILLAPVLLGALFPLVRWPVGTDRLNGLDTAFSRRLETARAKTGKFARFFSRPLWGGTLWIWNRTVSVADPHVRAGVRAMLALFFGAVMICALAVVGYVLLVVLITIAILAFVLKSGLEVMSGSGRTSSSRERDDEELAPEPPPAGPRGTRVVREGQIFDTPTGAAIDTDGRIVREGLLFDSPTGKRIDDDGRLVEEGLLFDTPTGVRIAEDGRIVKEGLLFDTATGKRIDDDGRLVEEGLLFDTPTGTRFVEK